MKTTAMLMLLLCPAALAAGTKKPAPKPTNKPTAKPAAKPTTPVLYQNDLEKLAPGKPPAEFLILGGEFSLVKDVGNTVLELPGEPVESFGLMFGPTLKQSGLARARFFGTSKGRRAPAFGVGLFGVSGYKLRLSPAADRLEILRDEEVMTSVPYKWKSGTWTWLKIQARPVGKEWKIEGRAWPDGAKEPDKWLIAWTDKETPPPGRTSLLASPYAGTPLRFDDLLVDKAAP